MFRDMWEYRFLLRHRCDPAEDRPLAQRVAALTERAHLYTERILAEMVQRNLLRATVAEISALAVNAWIISRYWLDYLQERHGLDCIDEADLQAGVGQLLALFRPYLTAEAKAQAEAGAPRSMARA
jgi:hypothetical protein